nr:MAG TPA: hypothetical protein [Caudoviricetes sp.]DAM94760.1 MAG TPA: hypothetical protein [Caudoviricetes sp.]
MKIYGNGIYRDMTDEEIAAMQDAAARAEAEEKHRLLSITEVQELLVRQQINTLAVDDATAYRMREFYPEWADLVAAQYTTDKAGFKFLNGGDLYKTIPATHTFAAQWVPGVGTESIYTRIDEQHDGSRYDPIPYNGNMELYAGQYYSQSGVTYHCTRATGTAVFNPLADLVGIYVEVVTDD